MATKQATVMPVISKTYLGAAPTLAAKTSPAARGVLKSGTTANPKLASIQMQAAAVSAVATSKALWNPKDHPRALAGASGGSGGQFIAK